MEGKMSAFPQSRSILHGKSKGPFFEREDIFETSQSCVPSRVGYLHHPFLWAEKTLLPNAASITLYRFNLVFSQW